MKKNLSASEAAKQKLILATIRLFAENGVDSVSLRMINREAGHKNNSALHYHFGSKLGLIEAVDNFIQEHFDEIREPELESLERRARDVAIPTREIMQVFVRPYVEMIEAYDWGYDAVRTIARMEFDGNPDVHGLLSQSAGGTVTRFAKLMRPQVPELSTRKFKVRFNHVVNFVILGFADYRNLHQSYLGDLAPRNLSELARFYVDMAVAVMEAPA